MSASTETIAAADLEAWIVEELARGLNIPSDSIDVNERFRTYGVDSALATAMVVKLERWTERPLPITAMWEHPTAASLASHVASSMSIPPGAGGASDVSLAPPRQSEKPVLHRVAMPASNEAIAVVGVGCRFPGGASSPERYWELLRNGVDAITEIKEERWDIERYFDADRAAPGKMNTRWGGFIERVDAFDPSFFGISPREAKQIDPQQRVILEVAWEALEDAGIVPETLKASATGVFVGAMWNDYGRLDRCDETRVEQHTATGTDTSIIAARISYSLGLEGPSLTVNTACSSSLVAVHLACQSLQRGESTLALAGGVSLVLSPWSSVAMSKFGAMSPDGRCRAFDARANGYVRGEGAGVVVLKPLSLALRDGDPIYCVILGSAVNNDGFSNGLTAPNPKAQEAVLRKAYASAGVPTSAPLYVETHGPGTLLGDPIEANALGAVLGKDRPEGAPLKIGSVKTNLGHTEAAAGIAGFIKVALAMKNGLLPPSLHFETPNPFIAFSSLGIEVQSELGRWPASETPPIAGVSAFGFGGTNCHAVLQQAPESPVRIYPLAAGDSASLRSRALGLLAAVAGPRTTAELDDLAQAAGRYGSAGRVRLGLVARTPDALAEQLLKILSSPPRFPPQVGGAETARTQGAMPRIVWILPGQGSQWLGMGRTLMRAQPAFRAAIEACDRAIQKVAGWSLLDELLQDKGGSRLDRVDVVQPVLFAMQVAIGALWRDWGIEPDLIVGHSMGEIAGAHLAGILTLDDAVKIVCARSRVIGQLASGKGAMLAVALPADEALRQAGGADSGLSVAVYNSSSSTVLSGSPDAVDSALCWMVATGIKASKVNVDYASHGPQMDALREALVSELDSVAPRPGQVQMISSVSVETLSGEECGASYWVENLRQPVRFMQALEKTVAAAGAVLLEISPHPVLSRVLETTTSPTGDPVKVLSSGSRDDDELGAMLSSLGALYEQGAQVRWERVHPGGGSLHEWMPAEWTTARAKSVEAAPVVVPMVVSGKTRDALATNAGRLARFLEGRPNHSLTDVGYSLASRRTHFEMRAVVLPTRVDQAVEALDALAAGREHVCVVEGAHEGEPRKARGKVAFVFPGQGSQWRGMGRAMLRESPAFAQAVRACDDALRPWTGWSVVAVLNGDSEELLNAQHFERVDVVQPALFAIGVGLAAAWRSLGLEPDAVVGHSQGEVAAAVVAGALSIAEGAKIIALRSKTVLSRSGQGAMLVVELPEAQVSLDLAPFGDALSIAVVNTQTSTVVSGDVVAIDELFKRLESRGVFCRKVNVDYASHSSQMDSLLPVLEEQLSDLRPGAASVPVYSTVTGALIAGEDLTARYWSRNLRETVRLDKALEQLFLAGFGVFVEVSAHPVLAMPLTTACAPIHGVVVGSLEREKGGIEQLYQTMGRLHVRGVAVNWAAAFDGSGALRVQLPTYAFDSGRYWLDERRPRSAEGEAPSHPMLRTAIELAGVESGPGHEGDLFTGRLSLSQEPWLADHEIYGMVLFPGAGILELALEAGQRLGAREVRELTLVEPLLLPREGGVELQLKVDPIDEQGDRSFVLYSREEQKSEGARASARPWRRHATGTLSGEAEVGAEPFAEERYREGFEELKAWPATGSEAVDLRGAYEQLAHEGFGYGAAFQGLVELRQKGSVRFARVVLLASQVDRAAEYGLHPALLDAALHALLVRVGDPRERDSAGVSLPFAWSNVELYASGATELRVRIEVDAAREDGSTRAQVLVADAAGNRVARIGGLMLRRANAEQVRRVPARQVDHLHRVEEVQLDLPVSKGDWPSRGASRRWVLGVEGRLSEALDASVVSHLSALRAEVLSGGSVDSIVVDLPMLASDGAIAGLAEEATKTALELLQSWLAEPLFARTSLVWIVGRSSVPRGGETAEAFGVDLVRAPLRGLIRSAQREHPDRSLRLVNLDGPHLDAELFRHVVVASREPEITVRGNQVFAPRLRPVPAMQVGEPSLSLASGGTVVVTGGTGELGVAVAGHLVRAHGIRHLVLSSRRGMGAPGAEGLVDALRALGALTVEIVACDVSDRNEVRRLFEQVDKSRPVTAVFHLAGQLEDGVVERQSPEQLRRVMAPKVAGAMHLHDLTRDLNLQAFVMFSSAAGTLGSLGQSNYAAANTFLDALAEHRRAEGLAGTSLAWGLWERKGLGMTAHLGEADLSRMKRQGLAVLTFEAGMALLDAALARPSQNLVPARIDLSDLEGAEQGASLSPLLRGLVRPKLRRAAALPLGDARSDPARSDRTALLEQLSGAPEAARIGLLTHLVQNEVAGLLRLPEGQTVPADKALKELGLDSLMAVELRNRLSTRARMPLPTTLAFDYPSSRAIAALLLKLLFPVEASAVGGRVHPAQDAESANRDDARAYREMLDGLSGDQTLRELREELAEVAALIAPST